MLLWLDQLQWGWIFSPVWKMRGKFLCNQWKSLLLLELRISHKVLGWFWICRDVQLLLAYEFNLALLFSNVWGRRFDGGKVLRRHLKTDQSELFFLCMKRTNFCEFLAAQTMHAYCHRYSQCGSKQKNSPRLGTFLFSVIFYQVWVQVWSFNTFQGAICLNWKDCVWFCNRWKDNGLSWGFRNEVSAETNYERRLKAICL